MTIEEFLEEQTKGEQVTVVKMTQLLNLFEEYAKIKVSEFKLKLSDKIIEDIEGYEGSVHDYGMDLLRDINSL